MKLDIFGKKVKLKYIKDLSTKKGVYGEYNPEKSTIVISKELKGDLKKITEIHEFAHAVFNRLGLHNASFSTDIEEIICDGLATALIENAEIKWKKEK
jgi:Zn-dependent peptidase ImmA (M78 family)